MKAAEPASILGRFARGSAPAPGGSGLGLAIAVTVQIGDLRGTGLSCVRAGHAVRTNWQSVVTRSRFYLEPVAA